MTPKHTPGPWELSTTRGDVIQAHVDGVWRLICTYEMGSKSKDECLANSRLMAAAPDMLALLIEAYSYGLEGGTNAAIGNLLKDILGEEVIP